MKSLKSLYFLALSALLFAGCAATDNPLIRRTEMPPRERAQSLAQMCADSFPPVVTVQRDTFWEIVALPDSPPDTMWAECPPNIDTVRVAVPVPAADCTERVRTVRIVETVADTILQQAYKDLAQEADTLAELLKECEEKQRAVEEMPTTVGGWVWWLLMGLLALLGVGRVAGKE